MEQPIHTGSTINELDELATKAVTVTHGQLLELVTRRGILLEFPRKDRSKWLPLKISDLEKMSESCNSEQPVIFELYGNELVCAEAWVQDRTVHINLEVK
jgi:hypothetical protein